jgi:hypothetical protein
MDEDALKEELRPVKKQLVSAFPSTLSLYLHLYAEKAEALWWRFTQGRQSRNTQRFIGCYWTADR